MNKLTLLFLTICFAAGTATGQKQLKPWQEWSKKDAEQVLTDSPWAHPQVDMDLAEASTLQRARVRGDAEVKTRLNEERVTYAVRFLSARPIRQAFIRLLQLQQKDTLDGDTLSRMTAFAERPSQDLIVIAVTVDGPDTKPIEKVMQVVRVATTATLRSSTYLERGDGERVYLEQYSPPGRDGFGARFIFPRMVDGKPFLTGESTTVRFVSDLGGSIKFAMTYKVKDMMLDGKLEY